MRVTKFLSFIYKSSAESEIIFVDFSFFFYNSDIGKEDTFFASTLKSNWFIYDDGFGVGRLFYFIELGFVD